MKRRILILFLLTGPVAFCQTKWGYIDYERVVVVFPQYSLGQKEIEKRSNQLTDSLRMMVEKMREYLRENSPSRLSTDSTYRRNREEKLNGMQNEFVAFQEHAKSELEKLKRRIEVSLRNMVVRELRKYGADKGIICVIERKLLPDYEVNTDLTDDFIEYQRSRTSYSQLWRDRP